MYSPSLKCLLLVLAASANSALATNTSPHSVNIKLNAIASFDNDTTSWLADGWGRYSAGEEGDSSELLAELQFGYRYQINDNWKLRSHFQAQEYSQSNSARSIGLVELNTQYQNDIDWNQTIEVTLGQFFLPISMENTNRFWESPYSINFSSLNSWIGEEFRPIGVDFSYHYLFDNQLKWSVSSTIFGGNDSMGALLAYRGWSYGRHRTVLDDVLALPDLQSLSSGGVFQDQRDDGTKPFGKDLDGRPGYSVRSSLEHDRYILSLTWVDNLGDTELHEGEYAWRTKFAILGASYFITDSLELLSEASLGNTTMGQEPGVDADFYSGYFMASYLEESFRYSLRYDFFGVEDKDDIDDDNNDFGRSLTFAIMWENDNNDISAGVEALYLNSKRNKITSSGVFDDKDSFNISMLASYTF